MSQYASTIWNYLLDKIGNEYGVAAMMGNLEAESALYPNNLQNSYNTSLGYSDSAYTNAVDSGAYTRSQFGSDRAGYGLAQWTSSSRKYALYDMWKSGGYSSISSIDLQLDYLWHELVNDFSSVLSTLKNATSIRSASDVVLKRFENPQDQSESVQKYRASLGQGWYDMYASGSGTDPDPDEPDPDEPNDENQGGVVGDYFDDWFLYQTDQGEIGGILYQVAKWAHDKAKNKKHGYDSVNRWGPDYDETSFIISAFEENGIPVKTNGATDLSNLEAIFKRTGFVRYEGTPTRPYKNADVLFYIDPNNGTVLPLLSINGKSGSRSVAYALVRSGNPETGDQAQNDVEEICLGAHFEFAYYLRFEGFKKFIPPSQMSKLLLYAVGSDII